MRRFAAALLVTPLLFLSAPAPEAEAGAKTDIALGLASFAVFNQVIAPLLQPRPAHAVEVRREVVYVPAPAPPPRVVYAPPPPPVVYAPPPQPRVVYYPHGRYELRGHGRKMAWVWIPAVPAPPPPPPPGY